MLEKFKARLVAGGISETTASTIYEGISSPTARTESVLIVAGVAAAEARKARALDIGGAFLNVDITKTDLRQTRQELDTLPR